RPGGRAVRRGQTDGGARPRRRGVPPRPGPGGARPARRRAGGVRAGTGTGPRRLPRPAARFRRAATDGGGRLAAVAAALSTELSTARAKLALCREQLAGPKVADRAALERERTELEHRVA